MGLCGEGAHLLKGARMSGKTSRDGMSKQAIREETERLIKEAMEKKALTVTQGDTRIETRCGKCGAPNRVKAPRGETRVEFTCKECGAKQKTL
jgi:transposase-like protein